jgi:hypothetical protein
MVKTTSLTSIANRIFFVIMERAPAAFCCAGILAAKTPPA